MDSSEITIALSTGIRLQAVLSRPSYDEAPERKLAVCLHPWSWLGGQMDDPVLLALNEPFIAAKYHVLRYNSRGVGKSTGRASFSGFSEGEDLQVVIRWALSSITGISSVVILGYSHGSLIASLHPVLPPPIKTYFVFLSYPLGPRGWLTLFRTSTYAERLNQLLRSSDANVLVIFGDQDEFTSVSKYRTWARQLEECSQGSPGRLTVSEVKKASHFWRGRSGDELKERLVEWLL